MPELTYDQALTHLEQWTEGQPLRRHARAVELTMRRLAREFAPDQEERFAMAGLLHDADYEKWPEDHPNRIVGWLNDQQQPELAQAVAAHYTHWGVPAESLLAKCLLAADEATGFVCACCYVRPGGIRSLKVASVRKKLKDKKFAAKVDRQEIQAGCDLLEIDVSQLIQWIIEALEDHDQELGIVGT